MTETQLTKKILDYLNALPNCKATKRHTGWYGRVGEPDITGCKDGKHFEIEVKRPGEVPTAIQEKRLLEWDDAGALAFWTDSLLEVKREIN